ncbi:hypothetical protein AB0N09_37700 [Streptomyces erythrochromogenes]|uniref:hypothetical protein n=1 Tax=Streptomyces erythrochromogenes TaxID=285574 RepID=UPI00341A8CDA
MCGPASAAAAASSPEDVRAFTASARRLGVGEAAALLRGADESDETRPLGGRTVKNRPARPTRFASRGGSS